jgi:hypothetical protein
MRRSRSAAVAAPLARAALAVASALALPPALSACGGAMPSRAATEEPLPPTADGTLAQLDRAEEDLRLALVGEPPLPQTAATRGNAPAATGQAATSPPQPSSSSQPPATPPAPEGWPAPRETRAETRATLTSHEERATTVQASSDESSSATRTAEDPCVRACRALASMERATEHLCVLSGSDGARCGGARARVTSARARVSAACPACAR